MIEYLRVGDGNNMIAVVTAGFNNAKDIVCVNTKLINNPIPTWNVEVAVTTE